MRRPAVAGAVAAAVVLGAAAQAEADTFNTYCNKTVSSKSRCNEHSLDDRWERNKADAPWTGGKWPMCERITSPGAYSDVWSRRCANALSVTGFFDDYCGNCHDKHNPGYIVRCWVGNNGDYPRIIRGVASYG